MAKCVYVNGLAGDNTWDGLSPTYVSGTNGPKRTIAGARAATTGGDLVLIAPGVYLEPQISFTSANDNAVMYRRDPTMPGKVVIDFENTPGYYFYCTWNYHTRFMDLHFRNPAPGGPLIVQNDGLSRFINCVFYDRNSVGNTRGIQRYNSGNNDCAIINCTFYNLTYALNDITVSPMYNCHFVNCTNPLWSIAGTRNYNAFPGNTETNGINTSTTDCDFIDAAGENFGLDPTDPDWSTFMTGGRRGTRIGAFSLGGFNYNYEYTQLRFLSPAPTGAQGNPQPAWENEGPNGTNTYTTGTPGDIIENASTYQLEIDLVTTPGATGGRVRSEVFDLGGTTNALLRNIAYGSVENPSAGEALDIDTTLPFQQEYRSSATSFAKGDASPTWQTYSRGDDIAQTGHRYIQFRVEFRTDHTNT